MAEQKYTQSRETKEKIAKSMRERWADPEERARRTAANQAVGQKRRVSGYSSVHSRLAKIEKGSCKAEAVGLPPCDKPAMEWALIHSADGVLDPKHNLTYSQNVADYLPLCKSCHRRYDGNSQTMWDRDHEGRAAKQARGEAHRSAHKHIYKLTEADVLLIHERRTKGHPLSEIAASFGVSVPTISMVASGKRWGHLKPPDDSHQIQKAKVNQMLTRDTSESGFTLIELPR